MAYYRKRCKCTKEEKEKCKHPWSFTMDGGIDPVTGERVQITRGGFPSKKAAVNEVAELTKQLSIGAVVKETDKTFEEFSTEWLEVYGKRVKISSKRARENEVANLKKYFKKLKIKDITKSMYQKAINSLKSEDNLSDNTISGIHGCARMLFKHAMKFDLIKIDPTEYAILPKKMQSVEDLENEVEIPKYLEKEELALFLKTAFTHGLEGDYETFLLLAYTGLRVGELTVLRESDMDDEDNTISITKTYYNPTNNLKKYELLPPKTISSKRVVEVEQVVIDACKRYITKNKEFKMLHRKDYYDKGYIFPNKNKAPGYPNFIKHIENRMRRLLKIAELNESLTPHSLRHTHTSLLAEAGASLEEIMDRLGHKDDETTRLVYLHVTKTRKKETSRRFGILMESL